MAKSLTCPSNDSSLSSQLANIMQEGTRENLTLADNRALWFEAIRDPNDPLLIPGRRFHRPLQPEHFLGEYVCNENSSQTRLSALKEKMKLLKQQEAQKHQQEMKRQQFIHGLMG